jgi:predicted metal-dependent phosphoesterase TrpH
VRLEGGRADLHIHPSGDWISRRTPLAVYAAIARSGLDVAVLADHNHIDVSRGLVTRSQDEGIDTTLVLGEEVGTRQGHLLAIGIRELVPARMQMADAVAAVHDQGGIAVIAHPMVPIRVAAPAEVLLDLAQLEERHRPNAVETMHPTALWLPRWRRRVEEIAAACGYAIVGGSDAHGPRLVGRGQTRFPGSTWQDLVQAIGHRTTSVEGRRASIRDLFGRMADQRAG